MIRAAVLGDKARLDLRSVELRPPGAGEVRLAIDACGICGTTLDAWKAPPPGDSTGIWGHEVAGRVTALGPGVAGLALGDRVCVEPNLAVACGACEDCLAGAPFACRNRLGLPTWGFADEMIVRQAGALPVPAGLPQRTATLAEPLASVIHGMRNSVAALRHGGRLEGARVGVIGAGVLGLLSAAVARQMGAAAVTVLARHPHQRAAAEALGAVALGDDAQGWAALRAEAPSLTVLAAGGGEPLLDRALSVTARRGEVVVLALLAGDQPVNARRAVLRDQRIGFSISYGELDGLRDMDVALAILAADPEGFAPLVTDAFSLADVEAAFHAAADRAGGRLRVVVEPRG